MNYSTGRLKGPVLTISWMQLTCTNRLKTSRMVVFLRRGVLDRIRKSTHSWRTLHQYYISTYYSSLWRNHTASYMFRWIWAAQAAQIPELLCVIHFLSNSCSVAYPTPAHGLTVPWRGTWLFVIPQVMYYDAHEGKTHNSGKTAGLFEFYRLRDICRKIAKWAKNSHQTLHRLSLINQPWWIKAKVVQMKQKLPTAILTVK